MRTDSGCEKRSQYVMILLVLMLAGVDACMEMSKAYWNTCT